jgi:PPOX class probable F420-dependent enzyme
VSSLFNAGDLEFLDRQRVARLGTADAAGRPHAIPVCFVRVGSSIYVPVDAKPKRGDPHNLRRLQNLRQRPEAVLLLDHYEDDWRHLRWLLIRATATMLDAGIPDYTAERAAALLALERRYPQYAAMRLSTLDLPVIALRPTAVRRWSAAS